MNSLRNRIAILLILAIVAVVGLATFAVSRALQPPMDHRTASIAAQLRLLLTLTKKDEHAAIAAGAVIRPTPAEGQVDPMFSEHLNSVADQTGEPIDAVVSRSVQTDTMIASLKLADDRWLLVDLPDFGPPPGGWVTLAAWIVLIVIGSAAVSVFAAAKIVRPLQLLESAVGNIGSDGMLPHVPEDGPGEVRATAQALNRLSSRLKAAIESRMRLVAAAGHDLRTPMTRMRLRAEFIIEDEEREKWLTDLEELDAIADSAMLLVREEVSAGQSGTIRLDHLVSEVVRELAELGYSAALKHTETALIPGAPLAIKRALRNLIINAATHGRKATIRLARNQDRAVVTISDEGPGIPDELLARVFEPFFRVDVARRKSMPGAGLGLAIAREIIERFGGQIAIMNGHPNGLVQTLTFPLSMAESQ